MILSVFIVLALLGFGAWTIGAIFGYQGVSVIGATIVVATGALVMTDGLEHEVGEIETETADGSVETVAQYEEVETQSAFPLSSLIMLVGGVLVLRSLDNLSKA